jgi:AcrR family transcriptional regulator
MARPVVTGTDPTAALRPPRRPGRPSRTSRAALAAAAVEIGLDTFTLAEVATRVGVGESTVYNYVSGRDHLYAVAAAAVFAELDVEVDADGWVAYVDTVAQRAVDLVRRHPGLREYVLQGPYEPSTIAVFETLIDRARRWLPGASEEVAFVVVSRPVVLSLGYVGDPVLDGSAPWLRRALLRGIDDQLARGSFPAVGGVSWRTKLGVSG